MKEERQAKSFVKKRTGVGDEDGEFHMGLSDITVTETQTDTEMIDISKTHTETNTEKIFNTDTIYI